MPVTLKDPLRNRIVTRAKSPDNIKRIDVGSKWVVFYTEDQIVSLSRNP